MGSLGVCTFCGDETMDDVRPMAHIDQFWAHRNAQRVHTPREPITLPSSLLHHHKRRILIEAPIYREPPFFPG
jgi:hypothetical protein